MSHEFYRQDDRSPHGKFQDHPDARARRQMFTASQFSNSLGSAQPEQTFRELPEVLDQLAWTDEKDQYHIRHAKELSGELGRLFRNPEAPRDANTCGKLSRLVSHLIAGRTFRTGESIGEMVLATVAGLEIARAALLAKRQNMPPIKDDWEI